MSSTPDDWVAALAEALWPHLERKFAEQPPRADSDAGAAAMNRQQAARYLGTTPNGLRKRQHPLLRPRRLPGYSRPLYFRRDLDAWLALGEPPSKGE